MTQTQSAQQTPKVVVLFGPSGVGKSTIAGEMIKECEALWLSRSWTTRARRPQESPRSYNFVTETEFRAHIKANGFLEWDEFLGNYYGTPLPSAPPGKIVMLEITLEGAKQVKEKYPEALLVFIDTPSKRIQIKRLRIRGGSVINRCKRLRRSRAERKLSGRLANHHVINDDIEQTVAELCSILQQEFNQC